MLMRLLIVLLFGSLTAFANEGIKTINEKNFNDEISSGLVLVDFYGPWCGPCQKLNPILTEVAKNMEGKVKVIKVNIDESRNLMQSQNVTGVPTLILFKNGKEEGRLVGFRDQQTIENFIRSGKS